MVCFLTMGASKKQVISRYMAKLGKKGGEKTGPSKARDPEKMRAAAKKRWRKDKDLADESGHEDRGS